MLKNFLNSRAFLLTSLAAFIAAATALSPRTKSFVEAATDSRSPRAMSLSQQWIVVSVADGDTITVRRGNERKKIRFCGIDSPEIKHGKQPGQPFGNEAKEKLRSLVATAKNQVIIIPVENDRYGRTIAEVMANGKGGVEVSFQEEMLKSGLAYYYKQYASNCPNHLAFEQAEKIAIASRAGVWSNPNLEKPWEYRRRYK
jgi:micrococcal nuclease